MGLPPAGLDPKSCKAGPNGDKTEERFGFLMSESGRTTSGRIRSSERNANANDSCYATVAYSSIFVNTTLAVIVINAVWIMVDTQWNHEALRKNGKLPLQPTSDVIEHLFCLFFTIELTIRFLAFRKKCLCFFDAWFVFDSFLVLFMVMETWIMGEIVYVIADDGGDDGGGALSSFSAFRLLRLLRLTRMVRIMRAVPELMTLVKGIGKAAKAVSFILMFLVIIIYVFAIVFTAQIGEWYAPEWKEVRWWDADPERDPSAIDLFGTIGDSMMTLFTQGVLGDNLAQVLGAIKDSGGKCPEKDVNGEEPGSPAYIPPTLDECDRDGGSLILFWVFIVFFIITALTLLNMLIGVLCEVITESARQENETSQIQELADHMAEAFATVDTSDDGLITRLEWEQMQTDKRFVSSMLSLGVEEQHMDDRLSQMQESLFGDLERDPLGGPDEVVPMGAASANARVGLSLERFIEKVAEVRPDTAASVLDLEILRITVADEEKRFNNKLDVIQGSLATLLVEAPAASENSVSPIMNNVSPIIKEQAQIMCEGADQKALDSAENWLQEVPTEVLFSVLKSRAPPEIGPPKLLSQSACSNSNLN